MLYFYRMDLYLKKGRFPLCAANDVLILDKKIETPEEYQKIKEELCKTIYDNNIVKTFPGITFEDIVFSLLTLNPL